MGYDLGMSIPTRYPHLALFGLLLCAAACSEDKPGADPGARSGATAGLPGGIHAAGMDGGGAQLGVPGDMLAGGMGGGGALVDPDALSAGEGASADGTGGLASGMGDVELADPGARCGGIAVDLDGDSAHCGACDSPCAPRLLATGPNWPLYIALSASHAYWITGGNEGQVLSVPLAGGEPTVLATGQSWPHGFAADDAHLYWSASGRVRRVPIGGGDVIDLTPTSVYAEALAVAADGVYFLTDDSNGETTVKRMDRDGGSPTTLVAEAGGGPADIALDATHVYWVNSYAAEDRKLRRVGRAGGAVETLATGGYTAYALSVRAGHIAWATFNNFAGSRVLRMPVTGGAPETLATGSPQPMSTVATEHDVYWVNVSSGYTFGGPVRTDGSVLSVSIAGGAARTHAPAEADPSDIAHNGRTTCWVNYGDGSLKCLATCSDGVCAAP